MKSLLVFCVIAALLLCSSLAQAIIKIDDFVRWRISTSGSLSWPFDRGVVWPTKDGIMIYDPMTGETKRFNDQYFPYVIASGNHIVWGSITGPIISNLFGEIQPYSHHGEYMFPTDIEGDGVVFVKDGNVTKWSPITGFVTLGKGYFPRMSGGQYVYSLDSNVSANPDFRTSFPYGSSPDVWSEGNVRNIVWVNRCFPAPYTHQCFELYFNNTLVETTDYAISDISIYRDKIVWTERIAYDDFNVYYWSPSTGPLTVIDAPGVQRHSKIWGNLVVYDNEDPNNYGVWGATLIVAPTSVVIKHDRLISPGPSVPEPSPLFALAGGATSFILTRRRKFA